MQGVLVSIPLLLLAGAPKPAPLELPTLAADDAEAGSLEALLREVRRRRSEATSKLEAPVAELVKRLDEIPSDEVEEVKRAQGTLISFGHEAAPLLVAHIDPGKAAGGAEKRLSGRVAEVLEQLPSSAITDELIKMAREGSLEGRKFALRVLGTSPDVAKASACLVDIFRTAKGSMRTQAVISIAKLGGKENEAVLIEALRDTDKDVLGAVLAGLTKVGSPAGRERARDLAGAPAAAAPLINEILGYYRVIKDHLVDEDVEALVRLAAHDAPDEKDRLKVLEAIPEFDPDLGSRMRKLFEPLLNDANDELREGAQICLARLGDRNQRRDLIKRYNEQVERNELWAGAYDQRGSLYMKLGDYDQAAKDYRRAIKVYENQGRTIDDDLYVELARANALDGNPKKASEALEDAGLTRSRLRKLAADPDFREVVESSRYGKVFDV